MNPIPLRPIRRILKITQTDMAVLLDVTRLTYAKWESDIDSMPLGKYRVAWEELSRLNDLRVEDPVTDMVVKIQEVDDGQQ